MGSEGKSESAAHNRHKMFSTVENSSNLTRIRLFKKLSSQCQNANQAREQIIIIKVYGSTNPSSKSVGERNADRSTG